METDSFFYRLLKQLPQTLFELVGLPAEQARAYRFDSVELKKSLRIDGLFLPRHPGLPLYFVEVLFQRSPRFYANLFAKVFAYLEENDPAQDWQAVAIFANRRIEPMRLGPYEVLLQSTHVKRIYLEDYPMPSDPPPGLAMLQLVIAPPEQAKDLTARIVSQVRRSAIGSASRAKVIQLLEELLIRLFPQLSRDEVRAMFKLEDLRKTRVWQEAHEEGVEKGRREGIEEGKILAKKEMVLSCMTDGMSIKQIAEMLHLPLQEVRRLMKNES